MGMKKLIPFIIFILPFLFSPHKVLASSFGISPVEILVEDLKPGTHIEKTIFASRSDPWEEIDVVIEPALGEMDSWFKFEPGLRFRFPDGENQTPIKVIIDVPKD